MKKYLLILLLSSCVKEDICNQRKKIPIGFTLSDQESISYVYVSVSTQTVEPIYNMFYYGDGSGYKRYIDTLDLTDDLRGVTGRVYVKYKFVSLDGSYENKTDTLKIQ